MNEHKYSRKLRTALQKAGLITWKLNTRFLIGVPDLAVVGRNTVWVEAKYLKNVPKRPTTRIAPKLSAMQQLTCEKIHQLGGLIVVPVFTPEGVVVFSEPEAWTYGVEKQEAHFISENELYKQIYDLATKHR